MSLLDRIVIDPDVVHGRPAIRGTRMRVADVLSLLASGATTAEILQDYPYLTADDIAACLEYAAAQSNPSSLRRPCVSSSTRSFHLRWREC
ncbi:DUF433 domain-containing protein [Microbacterium sp. LRZ72]|uniref:DUF433 domain-containing protein n=1 Tax=Microbacterium sp. LRZ72 TaxID=2942481 RepID=UPI0029AA26C2|nr:DUF433 domain-containing protein [Microbacterium sp. LRZ72]MDX2377649.1 DUF433 domain-containing protein [Microbacterium sp. LRZ72]